MNESSTTQKVLLAPDGCTKYFADGLARASTFDDRFAEWCLDGGRPERNGFEDIELPSPRGKRSDLRVGGSPSPHEYTLGVRRRLITPQPHSQAGSPCLFLPCASIFASCESLAQREADAAQANRRRASQPL